VVFDMSFRSNPSRGSPFVPKKESFMHVTKGIKKH